MHLPFPVVLASGSPRRRELLAQLVRDFSAEISHVDEDALTVPDPWETAAKLAAAKAQAVSNAHMDPRIVIAGDTVVALPQPEGPLQLGKPKDQHDAARMLALLSGQRHAVITGLAVSSPAGLTVETDTAWVTFHQITNEEIQSYVATGEPMDKAGAYAIQGGAEPFISQLEGDRETVIGFPTRLLRKMLEAHAKSRT